MKTYNLEAYECPKCGTLAESEKFVKLAKFQGWVCDCENCKTQFYNTIERKDVYVTALVPIVNLSSHPERVESLNMKSKRDSKHHLKEKE